MKDLNFYVRQTLDAGVEPIELMYQPIYDCYDDKTVAYRSYAKINSILYGTLTPETYEGIANDASQGIELAFHCLKKVMKTVILLRESYRKFAWISIRCPSAMLNCKNLYGKLKSIVEKEKFDYVGDICFEFGEDVLKSGSSFTYSNFSDIKAIGFKTAIRNCGSKEFPVTALVEFTPDIVFVEENFIKLIADRSKTEVTSALIRLVKSMGIEVVAEGAFNDDCIRELSRNECLGFIPSALYDGSNDCSYKPIGRESLLAVKE